MSWAKVRKFIRLIGPYPYNPYLIFLFFFAFFFARFINYIIETPPGIERWKIAGLIFLMSLIPALYFSTATRLFAKHRFWSEESTLCYVFEIAILQTTLLAYAPFVNSILYKKYGFEIQAAIATSPALFISSLILVLVTLALMHQAERKINERLALANNLVEQLLGRQRSLINADENIREQTSRFLHDRVQTEIMIAGMKLRSISAKSSPEINAVVESTISSLEFLRSTELKNLVQILAPNFHAGGIRLALNTLADQYRTSMSIAIETGNHIEELDSNTLLGIFRITEQSLLNSLVHGPANRVQVNITFNPERETTLVISDDGPGVDLSRVSSGVGSAVIDSWVGILGAQRDVDSIPGHGYQISVIIPFKSGGDEEI